MAKKFLVIPAVYLTILCTSSKNKRFKKKVLLSLVILKYFLDLYSDLKITALVVNKLMFLTSRKRY